MYLLFVGAVVYALLLWCFFVVECVIDLGFSLVLFCFLICLGLLVVAYLLVCVGCL